jgi:hypothetical protein
MRLHIYQTPTGCNSLIIIPRLPEKVEKETLYLVADILLKRFNFKPKMDSMGLGNFLKFEDTNGQNVYVALDQEDGLSIDSKNLSFIEQMKDILEKEVLSKVN